MKLAAMLPLYVLIHLNPEIYSKTEDSRTFQIVPLSNLLCKKITDYINLESH